MGVKERRPMARVTIAACPLDGGAAKSSSASLTNSFLPRLAVLFAANMLVIAAAMFVVRRLSFSSWTFALTQGSILVGVVLAASVCAGLAIALTVRASWMGIALAALWSLAQGYVMLGTRSCISSPNFVVRTWHEAIADAASKCLPLMATYVLVCLVRLWSRSSLRLIGDASPPESRQFQLAELLHAVTAAAVFWGLFTMFEFRDHPFLSVMDMLMMLSGSFPSVAPILWAILQPRPTGRHWWWLLTLAVAFPAVKDAILRHGAPAIAGDPWYVERHAIAVTSGYVAVAALNALLLRGLGFRWIAPPHRSSELTRLPLTTHLSPFTPPQVSAISNACARTQTSRRR
jgi:hypothetical protein